MDINAFIMILDKYSSYFQDNNNFLIVYKSYENIDQCIILNEVLKHLPKYMNCNNAIFDLCINYKNSSADHHHQKEVYNIFEISFVNKDINDVRSCSLVMSQKTIKTNDSSNSMFTMNDYFAASIFKKIFYIQEKYPVIARNILPCKSEIKMFVDQSVSFFYKKYPILCNSENVDIVTSLFIQNLLQYSISNKGCKCDLFELLVKSIQSIQIIV